MKRVFAVKKEKNKELLSIVEADPYAEDSFARVGYKVKDGEAMGEDPALVFLYISSNEEFLKKTEQKLKEILEELPIDVEERIIKTIEEEESTAEKGFGDIFG